jgi:glycosyltransferase involved in cell wall biosynthesis
MMPPLVSILIPCRNAGPFLRATLESALHQHHPNCEIILVDDGSTDDSLRIARAYEPRVKVFTGPPAGASAARNQATQYASGDWLQYLDADDLLLPHAVSSRIEAVDSTGGDVACGDWRRLTSRADGSLASGPLERADYRAFSDEPDLAVFNGFWAPPAALLYRRTLVQRIGRWNPRLPVIQDARFLFDAALHGGRFVHVPGQSAYYRQHAANSLSSNSIVAFWTDILTNNREVEAAWIERAIFSGPRRAAVAAAYMSGAHITFPFDRGLYQGNLAELRRFPEQRWSRYVWVATRFHQLFGYRVARQLLSLLRGARRSFYGRDASPEAIAR